MNNEKHSSVSNELTIEESIRLANDMFVKVIETNDTKMGLKIADQFTDGSLYHCYLKAIYMILVAVFTSDQDRIRDAENAVKDMTKISNRLKRGGFVSTVMKIIKAPNYEKYTDLEAHAELFHAYSYAFSTTIVAMNTFNFYGVIKCAFRMRKFLNHFQTCKQIKRYKREWESEISRANYMAGVLFANGCSHLVISQIPPRILRIANFLGYRGVESIGLDQINKSSFMSDGINSMLARTFLLFFWGYAQTHTGHGPINIGAYDDVLQKELTKYPNSLFFNGLKAKSYQLKGQIDPAIDNLRQLEKRIENNESFVANVWYYFELLFSYALKCDWNECVKYAELMRNNTQFSPSYFTFVEGVFRYVKAVDDCDGAQMDRASELFELVPKLRIRHLGKTITPEKVAVVRSEKYFKQDHFLMLPEMEILYQFNWHSFIRGNDILLNKFMQRIEKQVHKYRDDIDSGEYLDNYLIAMFYKGVIHRLMGQQIEAKKCFEEILENDTRIGGEYSLPAQACLEMGLTELEANNCNEAKKWLNKCIHDYTRYLCENFVHIRAYAALRVLGEVTGSQGEDNSKLEEYRRQWLKENMIEEKCYEELVKDEEFYG